METLADSVGLRTLGLGAGVINVLNSEIELVVVMLGIAAVLGAAVRQHPAQRDAMLFEERQHPVVQNLRCGDRRLAVVELGEDHLGVGIDEGLLINAANAFHVADIESVLGAAIAGTFAFELAVDLLLGFGLLQSDDLGFGQHEALLRHLGLQRLETPFGVRQIVAQPYCAHAEGRDRQALLLQLVGGADLAPGRLLDRQRHHRRFDLGGNAVLQDRLLAADLLQRHLAAFVVQLLKPVEAVAAIPHHLAGLADIAQLLGQFQHADLGSDNLLLLRHRVGSCAGTCGAARARRSGERSRSPRRLIAHHFKPNCQIKSRLLHISHMSSVHRAQ